MARFFITNILPEHLIKKYALSVAACNFSYNLASGGMFDTVYSIMPYYVKGDLEKEAFTDTRYELVYNRILRRRGKLARKISLFVEQYTLFKLLPAKSDVWVYNMGFNFILLYYLIQLFKPSINIYPIILDYTPEEKSLSSQLFLKIINSCKGNIRLANSDRFTCKNSIVLPGVVGQNTGNEPIITAPNNKFLLSGVLNEQISQLKMVIKVFSLLPSCELHITGFISENDEILLNEYTSRFKNIIYHGNISYEDYLNLLHDITFQLSTRNPGFPENQCNFPSKIIESLLHNRVVVSTISYSQLEGVRYFFVPTDEKSFYDAINNISSLQEEELAPYYNQGSEIIKKFNTVVWTNSMQQIESNARCSQ